jgi:uncharacterized RDD family membrane protein YckC
MPLASRSARLLAQLLDGIIAFSPRLALEIATIMNERLEPMLNPLITPGLYFFLAYYLFADALPGGQSVAKRMLGIAVVDRTTGQPSSLWQSFVRNALLGVLSMLDWIFIYGRNRQRLGDMAANTLVVQAASVRQPVAYQ